MIDAKQKNSALMVKKENGASWELNPGPLACFVFLFIQEVAQSENHTTRPHAHVSVGVVVLRARVIPECLDNPNINSLREVTSCQNSLSD